MKKLIYFHIFIIVKTRITILIENDDLKKIDMLVKEREFASRSHFINKAILDLLKKYYPKHIY